MGEGHSEHGHAGHLGSPVHSHQHQHSSHTIFVDPAHLHVDAVTICLVGLIGFAICFETFLHRLHKSLSPQGNELLAKVKNELLIMGFIAFCLQLLQEFVSIPHSYLHLFEFAHALLFIVALSQTLVIHEGLHAQKQMAERISLRQKEQLEKVIADIRVYIKAGRRAEGSTLGELRHFVRSFFSEAIQGAVYHSAQATFCERAADESFDFALYVTKVMGAITIELAEVGPTSWVVVIVLASLNVLRSHVTSTDTADLHLEGHGHGHGTLALFIGAGWAITAAYALLLLHAHRLLLRCFVTKASLEHRQSGCARSVHVNPDDSPEVRGAQMLLLRLKGIIERRKSSPSASSSKSSSRQTADADGPSAEGVTHKQPTKSADSATSEGAEHEGEHGGQNEAVGMLPPLAALSLCLSFYLALGLVVFAPSAISTILQRGGASDAAAASACVVAMVMPVVLAMALHAPIVSRIAFLAAVHPDSADRFEEEYEAVAARCRSRARLAATLRLHFIAWHQNRLRQGPLSPDLFDQWISSSESKAPDGYLKPPDFRRLLSDVWPDPKPSAADEKELWKMVNSAGDDAGIDYDEFLAFISGRRIGSVGGAATGYYETLLISRHDALLAELKLHVQNFVLKGHALSAAESGAKSAADKERVKIKSIKGAGPIKSYLPSELQPLGLSGTATGRTAGAELQRGAIVRIVKVGSQTNRTGVVIDPSWGGRVKIRLEEDMAADADQLRRIFTESTEHSNDTMDLHEFTRFVERVYPRGRWLSISEHPLQLQILWHMVNEGDDDAACVTFEEFCALVLL